jgi:hypothetical protein
MCLLAAVRAARYAACTVVMLAAQGLLVKSSHAGDGTYEIAVV